MLFYNHVIVVLIPALLTRNLTLLILSHQHHRCKASAYKSHLPFLFQLITHKLSNTWADLDPFKNQKTDIEPDNESDSELDGQNSNDDLFEGSMKTPNCKNKTLAQKNRIHAVCILHLSIHLD